METREKREKFHCVYMLPEEKLMLENMSKRLRLNQSEVIRRAIRYYDEKTKNNEF